MWSVPDEFINTGARRQWFAMLQSVLLQKGGHDQKLSQNRKSERLLKKNRIRMMQFSHSLNVSEFCHSAGGPVCPISCNSGVNLQARRVR